MAQSNAPQPNAIIYLARHGETNLNGGEGETERFRAWSNPPLNENGIRDAHIAGQFLSNKGIKHIFASDLDRTVHTAEVIHQYTGAPVTPTHGLRPWNLGDYTGQPIESNKKIVESYQEHPDQPVPGGESYNSFLQRFKQTFQHLVHAAYKLQAPILLVTHTRNINALEHEVKNTSLTEKSSLPPGGVMRADIRGGKMKLTDLDPAEGKKDEHKFEE